MDWLPGYTKDQIDDAQARYGLRFPPDLVELLRERRLDARYDWAGECPAIREMLGWPLDMLLFDVEQGFWWPDWGQRPGAKEERDEVVRSALKQAPKLIPLYAHRFLPETPGEAGNPVFSMQGFDAIYYGENLPDYLEREFGRARYAHVCVPPPAPPRHIPFWSDLVERFDEAYDFYHKAVVERGSW